MRWPRGPGIRWIGIVELTTGSIVIVCIEIPSMCWGMKVRIVWLSGLVWVSYLLQQLRKVKYHDDPSSRLSKSLGMVRYGVVEMEICED